MTFGIDPKGEPFYLIDLPKIRYETREAIKDASGKVLGHRNVTKELPQKTQKKTAEEMAWFKKVEFETIVLLHVADKSEHLKIKPQLFYRKYVVDIEKYYLAHKCDLCESKGYGAKYHFLRNMPSGIYTICWCLATRYGRSASGPIQLHKNREGSTSSWVKLIEEKKISRKDAFQILSRLQRVASVKVRLYLEGADMTQ